MEDTYSVDPVTSRVKRDEAPARSRMERAPAKKKKARAGERAEILREGSLTYVKPAEVPSASVDERLEMRKQVQSEFRDSVQVAKSAPEPAALAEGEEELPGAPAPSVSSSTSLSPAAAPATFDPVPSSQIDSIAGRLQIVEQILRKFGRAYDYRQLTSTQLMRIYRDLSSSTSASVSFD